MKIQFILGRSGSGKTYYCIAQIQDELRRSPEGEPLLLLVPEQATFQMEQAILADPSLRGFHRVSVLSFDRLARQVLLEAWQPANKAASLLPVLSESGRQMLLKRLLQQHGEKLLAFSRSARSQGFVAKLGDMIRECRQYQKTAEQLFAQAEALRQDSEPGQEPLAEKLHDLGYLLRAYEAAIEQRYLDPDDFLDLMGESVGRSGFLHQARLWIDGFAGFTPQQYGVLQTLTEKVAQTHISLCLDPASEAFKQLLNDDGSEDESESFDLFHSILQTWSRLRQMFSASGIEMLPSVCLPQNHSMPRFVHSVPLAKLEQRLFSPQGANDSSTGSDGLQVIPTEHVVVVRAADRRREVEAVAQHILRLCREKGVRFRDVAVILRDFSDYQPLLETVFADYGIAFFMDQRRSVTHHPLVNLLRSLLDVFLNDLSNESIFGYLKSDLVVSAREPLNHLENVVLSEGLRLSRWAQQAKVPVEQESQRWCRQFVEPLIELQQALLPVGASERNSVGEITRLLYKFLEKLDVPQRLAHWAGQAEKEGRLDLAHIHQQVYGQMIELLDDLVEVLGEQDVTLEEYSDILTTALSQISLAMVPPSLDQVLVGTIERSRHPQLRAAFILGVNEGRFPQVVQVDSFLNEAQRQTLSRRGFELAPGRTRRLLDERFLGYIALTRPREFLWVSYATVDEKGTALNPSLLIAAIGDAVEDCVMVDLAEKNGPDVGGIHTVEQLGEQLSVALGDDCLEPSEETLWQGLGRWGLGHLDWAEALKVSLGGLVYRNHAGLDQTLAAQYFGREVTGSISRLESFSACAYRHFSNYLLGLRERKELKLQAVDLGSFFHQALCDLFEAMQKQGTSWSKLGAEELGALGHGVTERLLTGDGHFAALVNQSYRNRMILGRAVRTFGELCQALREAFCASGFEQVEAELTFGPKGSIEGLKLLEQNAAGYILQGKIDRVDLCRTEEGTVGLSVVDYKRKAQGFGFAQFYHGLSLQLMSYLLVLQENYPVEEQIKQAATAVYVSLEVGGQSRSGSAPVDLLQQQDRAAAIRNRKANGIINEAWFGYLDRQVSAKTSSLFYSVRVNKEGDCYTRGNKSVVNTEEIKILLDHGRSLLNKLAGDLVNGKISISPYRYKNETACDHCCYQSLCRFDPRVDRYRPLDQMEKEEVLVRCQT